MRTQFESPIVCIIDVVESQANPGESYRAARERREINDALAKCDGNQRDAAKRIGMCRFTFGLRCKQYGIRPTDQKARMIPLPGEAR